MPEDSKSVHSYKSKSRAGNLSKSGGLNQSVATDASSKYHCSEDLYLHTLKLNQRTKLLRDLWKSEKTQVLQQILQKTNILIKIEVAGQIRTDPAGEDLNKTEIAEELLRDGESDSSTGKFI